MAAMYWIKLWHEILDDFKMFSLSDRLYRRTIECFLLAGELDKKGLLPGPEVIAWRLHVPLPELQQDLADLKRVGVLSENDGVWYVTNFAKRQAPMPKKEYMKRKRDDNIMDYYEKKKPKDYDQEEETEQETQDSQEKSQDENNETPTIAEIAFEKIKEVWSLDNTVESRTVLSRLNKCNAVEDGNGTLFIIPDTQENGDWLNARAMPILKRQIAGIKDYSEIEIVKLTDTERS